MEKLIGTVFESYNANGGILPSHYVLDSLNLSTANVSGLFQVGTMSGGFVGGYMAPVPAEWQSSFGAPFITGNVTPNILSQTSNGPAAFGFDPANFGSGVTPDIPYLYYPISHPLGPLPPSGGTTPPNPLYNACTQINGVLFPPGTRSVIFFGRTAMSAVGYY